MTAPYRILVTGSRDWINTDTVCEALDAAMHAAPSHDVMLVVGDCPTGADRIAYQWAVTAMVPIDAHLADWDHCTPLCRPGHRLMKRRGDRVHPGSLPDYCPGAGPRRNTAMVKSGADVALAFIRNGSRGASHTVALARRAGIPVQLWTAP